MATKWTPEDILKISRIDNVKLSPDGEKVIFTVTRSVMEEEKSHFLTHIHMVDRNGENSFQLTGGESSSMLPHWSPDGKIIAFLSERSGKRNIWLIRSSGGEAWQLTDVKTEVENCMWSPDGKFIAFTMPSPPLEEEEKAKREKNDPVVVDKIKRMNHIWLVSVDPHKEKKELIQLTDGDFHVCCAWSNKWGDWSPDGKEIAFSHTKSPDVDDSLFADISKVNIATGEVTALTSNKRMEYCPFYSPDSNWICYISSSSPSEIYGDNYINIIPSSGGEAIPLADTFNHLFYLLGWSKDCKYVYYRETRGLKTAISAMPADGSSPVDIFVDNILICDANINKSSKFLSFTGENFTEPQEIYITDLEEVRPVKISNINSKLFAYRQGKTEVIKWKSKDDMGIEGLLTYPLDYKKGNKYPLLLIIHGGPPGLFARKFDGALDTYPPAIFSSEGYLVLRPNIRGSDGYGLEFRKANLKDLGGMDYEDLISGVDYVINLGIADPEKLGVMGRSYGGYLTSWCITQTNRFKAASVGWGTANYISEQATTDMKSFSPSYFRCEYCEDPELYIKRSPVFNIKGVTTPTLIQHGAEDVRVPTSQSYELYYGLKKQKVPVEFVIYPRTGHEIRSEPKLFLDMIKRNIEWFNKYVMKK